ncbi:hypothetical protein SKAU_G00334630 [Synaphobranchus kaupii]|uniref:Uncharacterized protein n=1 Tax=Synaphobranchus kaupii TaxID=118154 RepID=A0A9Q1ELU9_SYNKA|nr:hypothetical protein SKAU_G00334630 [Synaphobranchus kaupii]
MIPSFNALNSHLKTGLSIVTVPKAQVTGDAVTSAGVTGLSASFGSLCSATLFTEETPQRPPESRSTSPFVFSPSPVCDGSERGYLTGGSQGKC